MLANIALTAGVVPFLSRLKEKASPALMGTAVVATLSLGYVLLRNVYPPAAAPYDLLPPFFSGLLLAASAWFSRCDTRSPTTSWSTSTRERARRMCPRMSTRWCPD